MTVQERLMQRPASTLRGCNMSWQVFRRQQVVALMAVAKRMLAYLARGQERSLSITLMRQLLYL
jgi:hypothetical protein